MILSSFKYHSHMSTTLCCFSRPQLCLRKFKLVAHQRTVSTSACMTCLMWFAHETRLYLSPHLQYFHLFPALLTAVHGCERVILSRQACWCCPGSFTARMVKVTNSFLFLPYSSLITHLLIWDDDQREMGCPKCAKMNAWLCTLHFHFKNDIKHIK